MVVAARSSGTPLHGRLGPGPATPGPACAPLTPGSTSSASSRSSSPPRCCTSSRPSSGRASDAPPRPILTVAGLAAGTALVALGFATRSDLLARCGRHPRAGGRPSRWPSTRRAPGGRALAGAATPAGTASPWAASSPPSPGSRSAWSSPVGASSVPARTPPRRSATLLLGPLVLGWVGLTVLASATHLVPAIGPGDPAAHARQRTTLGRWSTVRLVAANAGVGLLALGLLPLGSTYAAGPGPLLAAAAWSSPASRWLRPRPSSSRPSPPASAAPGPRDTCAGADASVPAAKR